jgi:hypothetical protein
MTSLKTPSALATQPGALDKAVACPPNPLGATLPRRHAPRLVQAWRAVRAAWLGRRLKRIETELLALTTRTAARAREGQSEISRDEIAGYESLSTERAVLRAQINRCRAPS